MLWGVGESCKSAAVAIAAADLDAHLQGPPTAGPLTVPQFDMLRSWGQRYTLVDEIVTIDPPAQVFDVSSDFPINAVVISLQINLETTITKTGLATKVGLGTTATADKYGKTLDLLKNSKINTVILGVVSPATLPADIRLFSVNNSGTPTGTMGGPGQQIRVRRTYIVLDSLPNAP